MRIFLDVGAYKGALSRRAVDSGLYHHVHAFDPLFAEYQEGVEWHHVAASNNADRSAVFHGRVNGRLTMGGSLFGDKTTGNLDKCQWCDSIRMADWIRDSNATEIDLHLDAEGAEYLILPDLFVTGMIDRITRLSVEWHADKIPSIDKAFAYSMKTLVASLGKPECLIREGA